MSHTGLQNETRLFAILQQWSAQQWLRPLDVAWGTFLMEEAQRLGEPCPPLLLLAAVLASHQVGRGHVCVDLEAVLRDPNGVLALPPDEAALSDELVPPSELLRGLRLPVWLASLQQPWVVGAPNSATPLLCQGSLLYLRRYWNYEQEILSNIEQRLANPPQLDNERLAETLERLFPKPTKSRELDWQKIACALAVRESFAVLTGGPGTGKTTTVVKLLATLQVLAHQTTGQFVSVRLAAPTGKAAARLNDSLRRQTAHIAELLGAELGPKVADTILAEKVSTIHRLLGTLPNGQGFRHHRYNRLTTDVVVIDEASMVDIHLLSCLFAALPISTRVILLGDKDQLASVEAGAVLGQLCSRAETGNYWPETRDWLQQVAGIQLPASDVSPSEQSSAAGPASAGQLFETQVEPGRRLDQAITMLRFSHRFAAASGIGQLAAAVNKGDTKAAWQCLDGQAKKNVGHSSDDLQLLQVHRPQDARFEQLILEGYRPFLAEVAQGPSDPTPAGLDAWAGRVLQLQATFQLLCTVRRGPWGVTGLNEQVAMILRRAGQLHGSGTWYAGRPVMVTRNDYSLRLMNGDIGVTVPVSGANEPNSGASNSSSLRVVFPDSESETGLRWLLPSRLGQVETVFAMTVHKSQGSEFAQVALVIPDRSSPVLTRELIYTGITRAAQRFCLVVSNPAVLRDAIHRRIERTSGPLTRSDNNRSESFLPAATQPAATQPAMPADPL